MATATKTPAKPAAKAASAKPAAKAAKPDAKKAKTATTDVIAKAKTTSKAATKPAAKATKPTAKVKVVEKVVKQVVVKKDAAAVRAAAKEAREKAEKKAAAEKKALLKKTADEKKAAKEAITKKATADKKTILKKVSDEKKAAKEAALAAKKEKDAKLKAKATSPMKPPLIKDKLNATDIAKMIAERSDVDAKTVKAVLSATQEVIAGALRKGAVGAIKVCGWNFKSTFKPATKGGEKKANPFKKGEFIITKPKPASMKVKALALKAIKDAVAV